ncbi:MAG: hypothetical protein AB7F89_11865, partial [Pirellulaceae bacterium]
GTVGLSGFVLGCLGVLYLTFRWVYSRLDDDSINDVHLHERAVFYYSMAACLLGAQFFSLGLLAELFTASRRDDDVPYSIRDQVGVTRADPDSPRGDSVPEQRSPNHDA